VKHVEVTLTENANELHLLIRDSGKGFDVDAAKRASGLGLTSMQERVWMVDGNLMIYSKPMCGTSIDVHIPLPSGQRAEPVAV